MSYYDRVKKRIEDATQIEYITLPNSLGIEYIKVGNSLKIAEPTRYFNAVNTPGRVMWEDVSVPLSTEEIKVLYTLAKQKQEWMYSAYKDRILKDL